MILSKYPKVNLRQVELCGIGFLFLDSIFLYYTTIFHYFGQANDFFDAIIEHEKNFFVMHSSC